MNLLVFISLVTFVVSWDPVAPGIDYEYVRYQDSNDVFIVRTSRKNPNVIIDTMVAGERVKGARELTTSLYKRYDDSLTGWPDGQLDGTRYKSVAAVNGYYFGMEHGTWISGGVANGWYVHRFTDKEAKPGHGSGYGIKANGGIFIGGCVNHPESKNYLNLIRDSKKVTIDFVNRDPESNSVTLYTPQYDKQSPANPNGIDILIEVPSAAGLSGSRSKVVGRVISVARNTGSVVIPFDCIVISARGNKEQLLHSVASGDKIEINQGMDMYDEETCTKPITDLSWEDTFSSLALDSHHLKDGKRYIYRDTQRHPRTSMAYNSEYIFFYVVDGRTTKSRGMTIDELSEFALNYLKATDGGALDGGGSSTMVINGVIKNHPSDNNERTVTNAVLFAIPETKSFSTKFKLNEKVATVGVAKIYAGPGTNFHEVFTVQAETAGMIVSHRLLGVKAKGSYWWYARIGLNSGWIQESNLRKIQFQ